MKKIWWIIKCLLGFGSIKDGSICWVTGKLQVDCHDYAVDKGGTGYPGIDDTYDCPSCGRTCFFSS